MPTFGTNVEWRSGSNEQLTVKQVSEFVWQVAYPTTTINPVLHKVGSPTSFDDSPEEPRE